MIGRADWRRRARAVSLVAATALLGFAVGLAIALATAEASAERAAQAASRASSAMDSGPTGS